MVAGFAGIQLGKYEIVELIGRGGMATVYKAYQRGVDRYVAVKVLPGDAGSTLQEVEHFRHEARTIARLQHPYILPLFDFGVQDKTLYLVMAFIEGGTLADLIHKEPLSLARIERIVTEVGAALDYAHRQGVIHRDVKPGNILLDREGHALLADFGIATHVSLSVEVADTTVVGTPTYMSPEQSFAAPLDRRSDIYSLGVVVFEMLAGRPPFVNSNPFLLIAEHRLHPIPDINAFRNDLPPGLADVMERVLAKSPDERYQTVTEFCAAFTDAVRHRNDLASPGSPPAGTDDAQPALPERTPATRPHPTNLPAQLTSFVGRQRDVAETCQRLRQPSVRLLTLVGPGGIGKTRLSIQVGAALLKEYEDGVFFIPLASLSEADAIVKAVAQSLKISADASANLLDALKQHLQPRHLLLIFDNFEHLLDAAPLLNDLLSAAAAVKILTTSREALFIYGEHTHAVPPLSLPQPGEDLMDSSAAALFIERLQALQPDFAIDADDTSECIIRICRALEGLPLALELAAARTRDLTLEEIAEQLDSQLALLKDGPRDLPARQRTMRGAIEWSYRLLSAEDQHAFARFAIFEGRFLASAAAAVVGSADAAVFAGKSLLQPAGDQVFVMLSALREYALERLAEHGEVADARQKHGLYYAGWLEAAQNYLNSPEQIEWYGRLQTEQYNFQAALEWFLQQQDYENAGRMVAVLWRYWATQSLLNEGARWDDLVLAHADQLSPRVRAGVLQGAGRLALLRHDYASALTRQQASLALYQEVQDMAGQAAVLLSLGETEYVRGDHTQAEKWLGEALNIFRLLQDEAGIGRTVYLVGKIIMRHGAYATAEPLLRESLSAARAHGSSEGVALALYDLAGALRAQHKFEEAEGLYRESLALFRELNFSVGVATILYSLGFTLQGRGDYPAAMQFFRESFVLLQTLDEPVAIAECLIGIAGAFYYANKRETCIRTLGAAKAVWTALNAESQVDLVNMAEFDRLYAVVLPEAEEWRLALEAGQAMPLEQIIQGVLAEANFGTIVFAES